MLRYPVIFALVLATLSTGFLGFGGGMVVRVGDDGGFQLDAPHFRHALSHARPVDHHPHDHQDEGEHDDLHDLIQECVDLVVATAKIDRADPPLAALVALPPVPSFSFVTPPDLDLRPVGNHVTDFAACRGGTALTLDSLRSVILLV